MYYVYVIKDKDEKFYKGMTNNIDRRLKEHLHGKTKTTKNMKEIAVIYKEEFNTRAEARQREKYLKSAAGRRMLKQIINSGV
ncbi:TPA: endonuclease [Candidatus Uhrbacteria bacterium]|nr:endonuclease [Candidatus Uhrbacteria bacterium]